MKQIVMKEKGFTLLELLVVVAIIAILSTGALLAYEGLTDKAQAASAANNTATADQSIRHYRALTQNFPDQWDNLLVASGEDEAGAAVAVVGTDGAPLDMMNNESREWLSSFALDGNGLEDTIVAAFEEVGIEEIQARLNEVSSAGIEPNLQHNEGAVAAATAGAADVAELTLANLTNVAIVPSGDGACTYGTVAQANYLDTVDEDGTVVAGVAPGAEAGQLLNKINDAIEDDECNLVIAFGFGHDAAHSTQGSDVAITTPPTFVSEDTNPNENYARYIALFHVGQDSELGATDDDIEVAEIFEKPRLLAVVDTEGNVISESIASATDENNN